MIELDIALGVALIVDIKSLSFIISHISVASVKTMVIIKVIEFIIS